MLWRAVRRADVDQGVALDGAQELRTVDLDGVEPGVWQLTVTVTDLATGRAVERTTLIDVGAADSAP